MKIGVRLLTTLLVASVSWVSAAAAHETCGSTEKRHSYGHCGKTFSIPADRLRAVAVRGIVIARPAGTQAIACCTDWNSAQGTTGCASFEGNECPSDAPFEAYATEDDE